MLSFFPRDVLAEILDLIELVSGSFPTFCFPYLATDNNMIFKVKIHPRKKLFRSYNIMESQSLRNTKILYMLKSTWPIKAFGVA